MYGRDNNDYLLLIVELFFYSFTELLLTQRSEISLLDSYYNIRLLFQIPFS